ncbi:IclR family transcriptional regulator [Polynucleobacter tropicus]|uniref:IclR family transcriptional regulator n=1 Tax=Polynucleobacter tropicus TaxID=1743174 RepID=A0A6M9Q1K6_9BURK|nr:IclR family transcriptional regulator [Polynucleobacter tropicus]QKM64965.1 IclR family transcriptional regulator [Polynucleobacter tropicus]
MELKKPSSKLNRSLERGMEILRCFKPGMNLLGNSEIAERTGLAPSTVSRLTQTLVLSGFLEHDKQKSAYRLAPTVLSLGHAYKTSSQELRAIEPLMRKASEKLKLNVGLAVADRLEMVYLESIRYTKKTALRAVAAGQRVPIERTSLGRAWIAKLPPKNRLELLSQLQASGIKNWSQIEKEIKNAITSMTERGYCIATWLPEISAISTFVEFSNGKYASLNFSTPAESDLSNYLEDYVQALFELKDKIESEIIKINHS